MTGQSKISYEQMNSAANSLGQYSQDMESVLNEVKTLFAKIGDEGVWSGTAAAETKATFDQLSAKFIEFSTAIADCKQYLLRVIENYKAVDAAINGQNM